MTAYVLDVAATIAPGCTRVGVAAGPDGAWQLRFSGVFSGSYRFL